MLSLSQRDCQLGEKYSGRKKRDEDTWTLKLELLGIVLERTEVNAILGEPHAFEALYDTSANPMRPFLGCIKAIELQNAWDGANVVLWYEFGKRKIELKQAKLTKLKVHPMLGGETRFSCIVEGSPPLDKQLAEIIERAGKGIEVEIHASVRKIKRSCRWATRRRRAAGKLSPQASVGETRQRQASQRFAAECALMSEVLGWLIVNPRDKRVFGPRHFGGDFDAWASREQAQIAADTENSINESSAVWIVAAVERLDS